MKNKRLRRTVQTYTAGTCLILLRHAVQQQRNIEARGGGVFRFPRREGFVARAAKTSLFLVHVCCRIEAPRALSVEKQLQVCSGYRRCARSCG